MECRIPTIKYQIFGIYRFLKNSSMDCAVVICELYNNVFRYLSVAQIGL